MDAIQFLTGVGRLVQGDCFKPNTTDQQGNPLTYKSGPNAGQPRNNFYVGVAFPKNSNEFNELWAIMNQSAAAGWPQGQSQQAGFSWKFIDGDGVDAQGKSYAEREGFAGHYIIRFSTDFAPKCYDQQANVVNDPEAIKRGYYVRVHGSTKGNDNTQNPGIYMNFDMVQLVGYGDIIQGGPDGAAVFGGTPVAALPAGASATPLAPAATPAAPVQPGMPAPAGVHQQPPAAPVQPGMPAAPAAPVQPGMPAPAGSVPPPAGVGTVPAGTVPPAPHPTILQQG